MIRYDASLPAVVAAVSEFCSLDLIESGEVRFLRDASGAISVLDFSNVLRNQKADVIKRLATFVPYADAENPVLFDEDVKREGLVNIAFYQQAVQVGSKSVKVLLSQRRIIGADWLRAEDEIANIPPVFAFCSLKGGVGRSTALSVAADVFSRAGLRVLAIDFDLEAPGLGSLLLPPENLPLYGTLDFFSEHGKSSFKDEDYAKLFEPSPYFEGGAPVYVVPAIGALSLSYPENVLAKISRAYVEDYDDDSFMSFSDRARKLLQGICDVQSFDVIFVDSRAGLHETVAAPMLYLGAMVLLFGGLQRQAFEGYGYLLSQLRSVAGNANLIDRLQMVQSRALTSSSKEIERFRDSSHKLFTEYVYNSPEQSLEDFEGNEVLWFNADDINAPHYPWVIGESSTFRIFEPELETEQLDPLSYGDGFGGFTARLLAAYYDRTKEAF